MIVFPRSLSVGILAAALVALAGCNAAQEPVVPANDAATQQGAAAADGAASLEIAGLDGEKERVSYMIGMDMSQSLEQIKDEIDIDTVAKAMNDRLSGGKLLMTDEQASQIREQFVSKLQTKQREEAEAKAKANSEAGSAFLADNAKKADVKTTESGLQYKVITEGTGAKPTGEDVVKVHYKGSLLNGEVFDSSYERGQPADLPLSGVVPGWAEGVQLMSVGSKYQFWIPGNLAYGEMPPPGAPMGPNETLVFEVELLDIVKPE